MSSPAGAIGMTPRSGRSSRWAARSAQTPPSEFPATTTASPSLTCSMAAPVNASSCSSTPRERASEAAGGFPGDAPRLAVADVLDGRRRERVELLEHAARAVQRSGGGEARQVERERALLDAAEAVEHEPPRVGRVREAVQQHERRALPLELERARLEPREGQPV